MTLYLTYIFLFSSYPVFLSRLTSDIIHFLVFKFAICVPLICYILPIFSRCLLLSIACSWCFRLVFFFLLRPAVAFALFVSSHSVKLLLSSCLFLSIEYICCFHLVCVFPLRLAATFIVRLSFHCDQLLLSPCLFLTIASSYCFHIVCVFPLHLAATFILRVSFHCV